MATRLRAYSYRCEPTGAQERLFTRTAGCVRWIYNNALRRRTEAWEHSQQRVSLTELTNGIPTLKRAPETAWLSEVPSHCLQQACRDLDVAFKNFFDDLKKMQRGVLAHDAVRRPRFKRKGHRDSFRFPDPKQFRLEGDRLLLPKAGWVRLRLSRPVRGDLRSVTVRRRGTHWYVRILTEEECAGPQVQTGPAVGIDLGVVRLATCSDGSWFPAITVLDRERSRLTRAQRRLSRKKKFSNNWRKQKRRISRIHERIADIRLDALHKTTTTVAKNHGLVVLEDLKVKQMTASAAGTVEQPGTGVAAKSGLNRSILDAGWGTFITLLRYKLEERGSTLVTVSPAYTSQRCAECGYTAKVNRPTQERFCCGSCGHEDHADENAAKNILAAGLAVSACGGTDGPREAGTHAEASA